MIRAVPVMFNKILASSVIPYANVDSDRRKLSTEKLILPRSCSIPRFSCSYLFLKHASDENDVSLNDIQIISLESFKGI